MFLTPLQLKEMRAKLHEAKRDQSQHCSAPIIKDGKDYRLEPKPKGDSARLRKQGFEVVHVDGKLHVKVPLGTHDADYLGINPESGEIVCLRCNGEQYGA